MFTHRVRLQLKPDSFTMLSSRIENIIMPLLRLQMGFSNGTTTVSPELATATEDTWWNTKEDAEKYHHTAYLEIMDILSDIVITPPVTSIFESSDAVVNQRNAFI